MSEPARKDDEQLSPFERFKKFARAIVAVPKAEIDKQEAQYQNKKTKERASLRRR